MVVLSPAKLNLALRVGRRRPDGYHELQTLFERISLSDRMSFSLKPSGIRVLTDSKAAPSGPKNLAYRAADLLKTRFSVRQGVEIRIQKRIPVGAGLGGGSSNAASTLLVLNRLWKLKLPRARLLKLAAELGSDVPFFILEEPFAVARGRGEKLTAIRWPRRFWHLIVKPPFAVSTAQAYAAWDKLTAPRRGVRIKPASVLKGALFNSLELVVGKRLRTIQLMKAQLVSAGARAALMSGSGSAVFGIFSNRQRATLARRKLSKKHGSWQIFVASTFAGRQ